MKNPRTDTWGTSTFRNKTGEGEPAEKTEGATSEVELKELCP